MSASNVLIEVTPNATPQTNNRTHTMVLTKNIVCPTIYS